MVVMSDFAKTLQAAHVLYDISINGVDVMTNGWLVKFTCRGKDSTGMEGRMYERVAFFEADLKQNAILKWDCIC